MREEFISQYDHFWRTFESVVGDFDSKSWIEPGHGRTRPFGLAFHILLSTKYYIEDESPVVLTNGSLFDKDLDTLDPREWPSQEEIKFIMDAVRVNTRKWLETIDFSAGNDKFEWTGKSRGSVVLFLLRHSQYHLGEMNTLLNEYLKGGAEDYFADTLQSC